VAVSRVGCRVLSLACSSVTAESSRSCYIVSMPTNLHRYYGAGYSHFITTSCYQRRPLLGTPRSRDLFLEVMEHIRQRHQFVVIGYVVMPEHVHVLFTELGRGNPSLVLAFHREKARGKAGLHALQSGSAGFSSKARGVVVEQLPTLRLWRTRPGPRR
jgi:REP element-mobilizing transposase RayT